MYKRLAVPDQLCSHYTNWTQIDTKKLLRVRELPVMMKGVQERHRSFRLKGLALACQGIVVAPYEDDYFVLNGKHRALEAVRRGVGVIEYVVEHESDISFQLPRDCLGGLSVECLQELFDSYRQYIAYTNGMRIGDLSSRWQEAP